MAEQKGRFDELLEHRRSLDSCKQNASRERDKTVLTIAGGSIAISISLIERVVPMTTLPWSLLLIAAWIVEIIAMWLILSSMQASESAFESEIYRTDHMLRTPGHEDPGWPNPFLERTNTLNSFAPRLTIVGVLLMLLHSSIAITFPATHKEKTNGEATHPRDSHARSSNYRRPDAASSAAGSPSTEEVIAVFLTGDHPMANRSEITIPSRPVLNEKGMVPSSVPPARPVAQSPTSTPRPSGQQGGSSGQS